MKEKSIRRNFLMNALLAVSNVLFPLISFRYASRILLPEGIGKVSFATSVIAYFSMFAQLGIPTYGIRACAKVRDDRAALSRTVHELLGINLAMDVLAYGLLAAAMFTVPRLGENKLLLAIISSTIFLRSIGMEWLYQGLEEYAYITARSVIFKSIALIALFLLVREESDLLLYGGISILASSASNFLNFVHARKYVQAARPRDCDWRRHLKPVIVFFGISCAATIYTNLDSVMLGFMTGDAEVGYYNAAIKVKTVLVSLITALGAVLLPRSAYYVEQGQMDAFRVITRKALHFILLAAPPVAVYFIVYAKESILVLSGEAFLPSVPSMQILMPTVLLIGLTNLLGIQMLVPLGKEKVVLRSEIAGALADLVLNLIFIPILHAAGAAIGTLAAEAVVFAVQYRELRGELKDVFRRAPWGNVVLGMLAALAAGGWVPFLGLGPLATLMLSAVLFFGGYLILLMVRKEALVTETLGKAVSRLRGRK